MRPAQSPQPPRSKHIAPGPGGYIIRPYSENSGRCGRRGALHTGPGGRLGVAPTSLTPAGISRPDRDISHGKAILHRQRRFHRPSRASKSPGGLLHRGYSIAYISRGSRPRTGWPTSERKVISSSGSPLGQLVSSAIISAKLSMSKSSLAVSFSLSRI